MPGPPVDRKIELPDLPERVRDISASVIDNIRAKHPGDQAMQAKEIAKKRAVRISRALLQAKTDWPDANTQAKKLDNLNERMELVEGMLLNILRGII